MRRGYPSDISREKFEIIRGDLESAKKVRRPCKYDLYDIFCAILYLVKEGCTWRAIPHDFPKWENVRYHYDNWAKMDENGETLLDQVLRKLVEAERKSQGRDEKTTMVIIDTKSIQNADTAEEKGYDAGKNFWDQAAPWRRCIGLTSYDDGNSRQCDGSYRSIGYG